MAHQSDKPLADGSEISRGLWVVLPLALTVFIWGAFFSMNRGTFKYWFERELGFIELATPIILVVAIVYGVRAFLLREYLPVGWLKIWLALVTAACIYFAGEEISWGQQFFGWQSPEIMQEINDQQETNIHNVSSWFDQKPRLLLELWIIIGGIFVAVLRKWKPGIFKTDSWPYWFWPGFACFPAALLAELVKLPERIKDSFDIASLPTDLRYSEFQELLFAVFLLCYLASNMKRLSSIQSSAGK